MKFCKDCDFSKKEVLMVGPTQAQSVLVCENSECRNPVDGSVFPCDFVRREIVFCGISGKHFKPREVVEEAPKEGAASNLIQLK